MVHMGPGGGGGGGQRRGCLAHAYRKCRAACGIHPKELDGQIRG